MRRSRTKLAAFAGAGIALLVLVGCTDPRIAPDQKVSEPISQEPAPGICNGVAAQRLIGKATPSDAEAMRLTGATLVRQIAPGDAVTHDLRDNRVTIETDPTSGRVTNAMCG
jgi:hypothetical protein